MKRSAIAGAAVAAVLAGLAATALAVKPQSTTELREKPAPDIPFILSNWTAIAPGSVECGADALLAANPDLAADQGGVRLAGGGGGYLGKTLRIPASIPRAGAYSVALTYAPAAESMLEHLLELEVEGGSGGGNGGESGSAGEGGSGAESGGASEDASAGGTDSGGGAVTALVPSIWIDAETRYVVDGAGNEYSPKQRNLLEPVSSYLLDYDSVNRGPIAIELPAGESELLVRNI
ncbi:MAG: hypothetical protein LBL83_04330, partial [Clostridiales bacterium]|nr:hypothetical protein [Clostridiales bacterium]